MDLQQLKGATVPIIVSAVYIIITALKQIDTKERISKFIPIIATLLGMGIGVLIHSLAPSAMIISADALTAAIVGAASGLASTGTNQIFKQLSKNETGSNETDSLEEK